MTRFSWLDGSIVGLYLFATMVAGMYSALAGERHATATAMHLRSARVFLPAASEKLASMLTDMEAALGATASHGVASRIQGRG